MAASSSEVVGGTKDRNKLLLARGELGALHGRIAGWIGVFNTGKPIRT